MNGSEQENHFVKLIGSSLVAITGRFALEDEKGEIQPEQVFACTAFAMSFDGVPVLVTAGHVIRDTLDPLLVEGRYGGYKVHVYETHLCDFFGLNPVWKKPTPFPTYAETPRGSIDQSMQRGSRGLDFGILLPRHLYWRGMRGNGVTPLPESFWAEPGDEFEVYKMVGFPDNEEHRKKGLIQTAAYNVIRTTDPDAKGPDGLPNWFVGTLPQGVESVRGVSGGPIFGFRRLPAGGWEYRVVAMQSWQGPEQSERMVYGTPLRSFAPTVSEVIAQLRARGEASEQAGQEG